MNELEIGFRTAMVGGFQRDDVLKYIEEMAQGHAKETEASKVNWTRSKPSGTP